MSTGKTANTPPSPNPATNSDGLLQVGEHCSLCSQLDFLPFVCDGCGKTFCEAHRKPAGHACVPTGKDKKTVVTTTTPQVARKQASAVTASAGRRRGGTGTAAAAPSQTAAQAKTQATAQSKAKAQSQAQAKATSNNAALEKLKNLWSGSKSSTTTTSTNSTSSGSGSGGVFAGWKKPSLASKASTARADHLKAIAEIKRTAKGDPKVPLMQRRYLYVQTTGTSTTTAAVKKAPLYFKKDTVTGKVLDKAADALNLNLKTANTTEARMALFHERTGQFVPYNEKLDVTLGGDVKDGDVLTLKLKPVEA